MAIKKLQNNFTTPEQSKRLLELGVPADSADCYYYAAGEKWGWEKPALRDESKPLGYNCTPCWSVGRLMEIIRICNLTSEKPWVDIEQDNIRALIIAITDGVNNHMLDFSKLED